ncbi:Rv2231c family pyridoxal phosphate-dependent protein CobC [Gordonia sinesedis]
METGQILRHSEPVGTVTAVSALGLSALDRHGDADSEPGLIDFAVNVRGAPPDFVLDAVAASLAGLADYPSAADTERVRAVIGAAHGRPADQVVLLAGASDGFAMLPALRPRRAALLQPSFTEPELVLRAAGVPISQVVLDPPWTIDAATIARRIPDDADLVVLGNPTNPTSVLHSRRAIEAMRRPGRLIVVDEAFADLTTDPHTGRRETESLASVSHADIVVIRSVTKTFGLAGLRAGYLLGAPEVLTRLTAGRRAWPVSTPALAALAACASPAGWAYCDEQARRVAADRAVMIDRLRSAGITVCSAAAAPFVLIRMSDGIRVKSLLREWGWAVRSCANFVGLDADYIRLAVRPPAQVDALVDALVAAREEVRR